MKAPVELRNYQLEGVRRVKTAWRDGEKPLVYIATGGGKSTIISKLVYDCNRAGSRCLIIGHTEEIITQLEDTIQRWVRSRVGVVMGTRSDAGAAVVVASRQSLYPKRLNALLLHGSFGYLFIDEAHHATRWNSYGRIVQEMCIVCPELKIAGFTATPSSRCKGLFTGVVFEWTVSDGMRSGYLVPLRELRVTLPFVASAEVNAGVDFVIDMYLRYIYKVRKHCIVFFRSVGESRSFVSGLLGRGIAAAHVDGGTPKCVREEILSMFRKGVYEVLSNMGVLVEGFDAPKTDSILLVRTPRSPTLLTQILGRGLRCDPAKTDCLLLNICEN